MRRDDLADADCGIAQAVAILDDWWTILIVRDIAGGITRFDDLQRELGISRRTLSERLHRLAESGVLDKVAYQSSPPRFDYTLTSIGLGLVPVLIALQDWGTRYVVGDGSLTALAAEHSSEGKRLQNLLGHEFPAVPLGMVPGGILDVRALPKWKVIYTFSGAYATANAYPPHWSEIPGARGCTLEARTYADYHSEFLKMGTSVIGISTQRVDELEAFSLQEKIPFTLASDEGLELAISLRLPTFRAGGSDRLKRTSMLVGPDNVIRHVQFPVADPVSAAEDMLALVRRSAREPSEDGER